MKALYLVRRYLTRPLGWVGGALTIVLMVLTVTDVIVRKVTGTGVPGNVEYGEVLLVICVFLGLGAAQMNGDHISTSLVTSRLSPNVRRAVRAIGFLVGVTVAVVLLVASVQVAMDSVIDGEYRFGLVGVPMWPARVAVAIGALMFLLEYALTTLTALRADMGQQPSTPGSGAQAARTSTTDLRKNEGAK